jgi:cupin 2 domain-containing protein
LGNLYADLPDDLSQECFDELVDHDKFRLARIVSVGHASPEGFWYDQPDHEWVLVLKGEARLRFDGRPASLTMRPGDHVLIPAHRRHRVEWTKPDEPTIWLALHFD